MTSLLVAFMLLVNLLAHRPLLKSFLFALALAVGLTPELLPMIVTITLTRGALRLFRQHVIVKRLSAIQDLGAIDILCADKTGTLTEGKIRLERHLDAQGNESDTVLRYAWLNCFFESGMRTPMEDAVLAHGNLDAGNWRKIDEVLFDFERRRLSVLLAHCIAVCDASPAETPGVAGIMFAHSMMRCWRRRAVVWRRWSGPVIARLR